MMRYSWMYNVYVGIILPLRDFAQGIVPTETTWSLYVSNKL